MLEDDDEDDPIWKNEEQNRDIELEEIIGSLLVSERQESKIQRTLTNRLDPQNPLAFSKANSEYVFYHAGRSYKVSVNVNRVDIKEHEEKKSPAELVRMLLPAFGITALFFLTVFLTISINDIYFNGQAEVAAAFLANDESVEQILKECRNLVNLENPNPRLYIAFYTVCDKQIKQVQEFCESHSAMSICEDKRIDEYLVARRLS